MNGDSRDGAGTPKQIMRIHQLTALCFALSATPAILHAESHEGHEGHAEHAMPEVTKLVCHLQPTEGNKVSGTVTFTRLADGKIRINAEVSGLSPDSEHAMHIHEFGDLSATDGTATGGHYNPEGHDHGLPGNEVRHAGDFGNLKTDGGGKAEFELVVDNITLNGAKNPIIGRGMIVHADVDDGGQPTGNAGARIAQGVIGVAGPEKK